MSGHLQTHLEWARAAREKISLDNKDSFAYVSKYLNLDFLIEVVVIGLNPA
jgi:hypothetical protein